MNDPTQQNVIDFWKYMTSYYGSSATNKNDSSFMSTIGWFLGVLGIQDKDKFMAHYTTTIGTTIYTPFVIGTELGNWDLWSQIVVCIHEHMHVVQYKNEGISFMWNYLMSSTKRAMYEAEAYRCNLEMTFQRYNYIPDTLFLAQQLASYNVDAVDIGTVKKMLDLSAISVRAGAIINQPTKIALDWLKANTTIFQKSIVINPTFVLNPTIFSLK